MNKVYTSNACIIIDAMEFADKLGYLNRVAGEVSGLVAMIDNQDLMRKASGRCSLLSDAIRNIEDFFSGKLTTNLEPAENDDRENE